MMYAFCIFEPLLSQGIWLKVKYIVQSKKSTVLDKSENPETEENYYLVRLVSSSEIYHSLYIGCEEEKTGSWDPGSRRTFLKKSVD